MSIFELLHVVLHVVAKFFCQFFSTQDFCDHVKDDIKQVRDALPESIQPTFDKYLTMAEDKAQEKAEEAAEMAKKEAEVQAPKAASDMYDKLLHQLAE